MPTNNPRVSITLSPDDLAVIDRFAAASGTPRATVLSGLVSSVLPQLVKAAELMELASEAPRNVQESLAEGVRLATEQAAGAMANTQDTYDGLMRKLKASQPGTKARERKGATAPGSRARGRRPGPPPTNRGVKK